MTQKIKIKPGTMAEIEKVGESNEKTESRDRICPLMRSEFGLPASCRLDKCAWFDFENDCCAVLAIGKVLGSLEEWERDRA